MDVELDFAETAAEAESDGILFVNETKNDLDTGIQAMRGMMRKMKYGVGAGLGGFLMALGLALLLLEIYVSEEKDYFFSVFLLVFGAVFFLFMMFFFDKLVRSNAKKLMQGKEGTVVSRFRQDGFEIVSRTNDGLTGTTQGEYNAFTQCVEYDDLWTLYYNKATTFVLKKDGMRQGSAQEFSDFLRTKIVQYKDQRKKK